MLARLRSFAGDRRGATAVEFAIVALPFILLVLAILEYALIYLVTVTLESATVDSARMIRTGEVQKAQMSADDFKKLVCSNMGWLASECPSKLYVDARTFSTFSSEASPTPVSGGKFDSTKLQFNVGGPGSIVLVTTYYQWALLTPALLAFSNVSGDIDVVPARSAFRNEPYTSS